MTSVAIIGAGAAGLVAAREMRRAGFEPVIFEQSDVIGGVWVYSPESEDDPPGSSPHRRVFSSMYESLRTNLPRDLMAFTDYSFDSAGGGDDDWPRYPHHTAVLEYLQRFANDFELQAAIRFRRRVMAVEPLPGGRWRLAVRDVESDLDATHDFDAVMVCNGHYSRPRIPPLDGVDAFARHGGRLGHSHNYRTPARYDGKSVALWGTAASGADISIELARHAKRVYWCGNAFPQSSWGERLPWGAVMYPSPSGFDANGNLCLPDGSRLDIDEFMYCTGYRYEFPFLNGDIVEVEDNRVYALYRDIVPPRHPTLAFIGIPFLVVPFPLFEMQSKWFAHAVSGKLELPAPRLMLDEIDRSINDMKARGIPQRHYHKLGDRQTDYYNRLASDCGEPPLPDWFSQLAAEAQQRRMASPVDFREQPLATRGSTVVPEPNSG